MATSPLRYPGGKAKLFPFFAKIIQINGLFGCNYCEPYAGGAGLALKLLTNGFVDRISLNDIDPTIYAFWHSVLRHPDKFCKLIENTPVTIEEWFRQRACWTTADKRDPVALGFSTYFLNRTSRSGIIEGAGPIGGYKQSGKWKVDVRLVKDKQIDNILSLSRYANQIDISNRDALDYISEHIKTRLNFMYLDPPYYVKGAKLYKNFYVHDDHLEIAGLLRKNREKNWVVSYDDVPQIREIYYDFIPVNYMPLYCAGKTTSGHEVIYFSDTIQPPPLPPARPGDRLGALCSP